VWILRNILQQRQAGSAHAAMEPRPAAIAIEPHAVDCWYGCWGDRNIAVRNVPAGHDSSWYQRTYCDFDGSTTGQHLQANGLIRSYLTPPGKNRLRVCYISRALATT
jgi:hypothetical protein